MAGAEDAHLQTTFDLIARFGAAESYVNTARIDFGTTEGEQHLIAGWGKPETTPNGPVQWAMGRRSAFWIFTADRRAVRLTCRMWPLVYEGAPVQKISVEINGHPLTSIELEPRQRTYTIDLPEDLVVAGRNRIDIEHSYSGKPDSPNSDGEDLRPLAVLWDWLSTDLPPSSGAPRVERTAEAASIVLPPGSGLSYFLSIPSDSRISASGLRWSEPRHFRAAQTALAVRASADRAAAAAAEQAVDLPLAATGENGALHVPIETSGIVRLSLFSPPMDTRGGQDEGIEIVAPLVRSPPGETPEPSDAANIDRPKAPPNVVIYLIDTLRSDHLGAYGYGKPTSPNIDAFAEESVVFFDAVAQTSWTRPAVASILTGLSIPTHGIINMTTALSPRTTTIAEVLQANGYATAAFTLNAQISPETGFDKGFDQYKLEESEPDFDRQLLDHLARTDRPFFAYVHTIEPHTPYEAEPPLLQSFAAGIDVGLGTVGGVEKLSNDAFRLIYRSHFSQPGEIAPQSAASDRRKDELVALYDAEVASADARFARFVERLRDLDLYDDTLLILLADHGEEFYDHGRLAHGMTLYGEQTRIPLIMRFPAAVSAGRRVEMGVSQIDIFPTILDYLQIAPESAVEGRSLLPLVAGGDGQWVESPAFSYLDWFGGRAQSVVAEGAKLIHNLEMGPLLRPRYELYDLREDPDERNDIADQRPILLSYLRSLMREAQNRDIETHEPGMADILDPAFRERMRALGYLE